ncbi:hypothetical protein DFH06DRAFT_1319074 [Mycena polygramma]|nr:hypothetical protein DFH06DRAFT_1319074 [Mycena polygramma]
MPSDTLTDTLTQTLTDTIQTTVTRTTSVTSTWTGLTQATVTEAQTACPDVNNCIVFLTITTLVPAATSPPAPVTTTTPPSLTPTPTSSSDASSAPADKPNPTTPSATASLGDAVPTSRVAASTDKQPHSRTQVLVGGLLGGLCFVGTIIAILFMLRRRRLQQQKRDSQFLVDPEQPNPLPQSDDLVSNGVSQSSSPTPLSAIDSGMAEKAVFRRADLQQQVQQIEAEMAELQRVGTRSNVANPSDSGSEPAGGSSNTQATPNAQLAVLRARVLELERQRDLMWDGEAPPGYRQW